MSSIEQLQERVSQAEARFGVINEARERYSERLLGLINAIESRLRDQHGEIKRQAAELAAQGEEIERARSAVAENQALRGMLHSLLQAIEAGGRDVLSETMQTMDARVSALISENVKPVPAFGPADFAAPAAIPSPLPELEAPAAAPEAEAAGHEETSEDAAAESPQDLELEAVADAPAEPPARESDSLEGEALSAEPEIETGTADAALLDEFAPLDDVAPEAAEPDPLPGNLLDEPTDTAELAAPPEVSSDQETIAALTEPGESEWAFDLGALTEAAADDPDSEAGDVPDEVLSEGPWDEDMPEEPALLAGETPREPAAEPGTAFDPDFDDAAEAASLEDIMRRVSRLVEEEGLDVPASGGDLSIDEGPSEPEAREAPSTGPDRAVSNG